MNQRNANKQDSERSARPSDEFPIAISDFLQCIHFSKFYLNLKSNL
jgi:hypothetical protein